MKKIVTIVFTILLLTSCSQDDNAQQSQLPDEIYGGKWSYTDSLNITTEIEFTPGQTFTIVTKSPSLVVLNNESNTILNFNGLEFVYQVERGGIANGAVSNVANSTATICLPECRNFTR